MVDWRSAGEKERGVVVVEKKNSLASNASSKKTSLRPSLALSHLGKPRRCARAGACAAHSGARRGFLLDESAGGRERGVALGGRAGACVWKEMRRE